MYFIKELVPSEQYKNILAGYYCDSLPARCLQIVAVHQKALNYFVYDPNFPQENLEKLSTFELYEKVLDSDILNLPIQKQGSRDVIVLSLACNKIIALKFDDILSNFMRCADFDLTSVNKDAASEMHRVGSKIKCIRQKIFASSFVGNLIILNYDDRKNMISQERVFEVKSMINGIQFDPIKSQVYVLSNDYSPEFKKIKVMVKNFICKAESKDKMLINNVTIENDLHVSMHAMCFQVLKSGAILYANKNALLVYYPNQLSLKTLYEVKDEFILGIEEYIDCLLAISDKSIILLQQDEKSVRVVDGYPMVGTKDLVNGYSLTNQNMKNYLVLLTQESLNIFELEIDLKNKHFSQKFHFSQRLYTSAIDTVPSSSLLAENQEGKRVRFQDKELFCLRKVVNEEKSLSNQIFKLSSNLKLTNYIEKEIELPKDVKKVWYFDVSTGEGLLIATRAGSASFALEISYGKSKFNFEHSKTFKENFAKSLKDQKIIDVFEANERIFIITNQAIFESNYKNKSISGIYKSSNEIILQSSFQDNMNGRLILYIVQKDGLALLLEYNQEKQLNKKLEQKIDLRVCYVNIFCFGGRFYCLQSFFGGKLGVFDLSKKDDAEVVSMQLDSTVKQMASRGNILLLGTNGKLQIFVLSSSDDIIQINPVASFEFGTGPVDIVRVDDAYLVWNNQAFLIKQDKESNFSKQKVSFKSNLKAWFYPMRGLPWLIAVNDNFLSVKELHSQAEYLREEVKLPLAKVKSNSAQSQKCPALQRIFLNSTNRKLSAISDKLIYFISNSQETSTCGSILPLGEHQMSNEFENVTFVDTEIIDYKQSQHQVLLIALSKKDGANCTLFMATIKPEKLQDVTSNKSTAQLEVMGNIEEEINFRIIGVKFFKGENILVLAGRKSFLFYTYQLQETSTRLILHKFKKRIETNARSFVVNIDTIDHYLMVGDSTAGITIYEVKSKSLGENLGFTVELALKYVDLQPCLLNSCIFISSQHALGVDKYGTAYLVDFQEKTFARTIPRSLENELPETGRFKFYQDDQVRGAIFTGIAGGVYLIYGLNKEESTSKLVDFQTELLNLFQLYLNERYRLIVAGEVWRMQDPQKKKQFISCKLLTRYLEDTLEAKNKLWVSFVNRHEEYSGMSYQELEKLLNEVLC